MHSIYNTNCGLYIYIHIYNKMKHFKNEFFEKFESVLVLLVCFVLWLVIFSIGFEFGVFSDMGT